MKIVLVLVISVLITACSNRNYPEAVDVPDLIEDAFRRDYPRVEVVGWQQANDNYTVEFEENGIGWEVEYDVKGTRVSTSSEIDREKLPTDASTYIVTNYAEYEVDEVRQIRLSNGKIYYEVRLDTNEAEKELVFRVNGEFMHENEKASDELL